MNLAKILFLFVLIALPVYGSAANLKILGIQINCDPALPPTNGGCGIGHFTLLIEGIIKFLTQVVVVPVAVLMIIWAAFVIITAGGSEEKVRKGKTIITTAVIGVIVAFLAGAIVGIIYELFTGRGLP